MYLFLTNENISSANLGIHWNYTIFVLRYNLFKTFMAYNEVKRYGRSAHDIKVLMADDFQPGVCGT